MAEFPAFPSGAIYRGAAVSGGHPLCNDLATSRSVPGDVKRRVVNMFNKAVAAEDAAGFPFQRYSPKNHATAIREVARAYGDVVFVVRLTAAASKLPRSLWLVLGSGF